MTRFLAIFAALLVGCDWHIESPGGIEGARSVAIGIPVNETLRRGNEFGFGAHEFDLAQQVSETALAEGFDILPAGDADLTAEIQITSYRTPFLVSDAADRPLVSNVSIEVHLVIRRRDGTQVWAGDTREVGYLVPSRDEDEGTARAEAFHRLSAWVVNRLKAQW